MSEEINESEWALVQILSNPVLFREFINDGLPGWEPLLDHERAWSTCTAPYQVFCCGRSVHKTTAMIEMLYWWMINGMFVPGDQGLFALVPNKAQRDLSFFRIRSACLTHWLIRQWVGPNSINQSEARIDFTNGFQFLMRIAGASGSEGNVIGFHGYRIWVDEAQGIPWQVWLSLQNCLRVEIPGYQMIVSGVPNGGRNENVLYECDTALKYVSFNIAQTAMRWWNLQVEYEKRKEFHAEVEDSEDYKHYVLGQHGLTSYAVFDRARFLKEDYEVRKIVLTEHLIDGCRRVDPDGKERYHYEEIIFCPPIPLEYGKRPLVGIGYDVGYSPDPTVFFILVQQGNATWRVLTRFVLQHVEYPKQAEIFAWLDRVYSFDFLGIDMGGPGKPQYQALAYSEGPFAEHKFGERMYPVEFGSHVVVAIDDNGDEKKDQTKRVAVDTLSRWVHEKRLSFAMADDDLMGELERTKFSRTITGDPVYRTENDHQMAALMCAILAHENKFGTPIIFSKPEIKPHLLSAKWLDPFSGIGV